MMTIEDFRRLTAKLFWGEDAKVSMKCDTSEMFIQLLEMFRSKKKPLKLFSSGDSIQVKLYISKCKKDDGKCAVPHNYKVVVCSFHGEPNCCNSYYTYNGIEETFSFHENLFRLKFFGSSGVKPVLTIPTFTYERHENDFQLYQQLWISSYLPTVFKANSMKYELLYDDDDVCGIEFFITPEWLLA